MLQLEKKRLINKLAKDGLSNHQRVRETQEDTTQYLRTMYSKKALVCPSQLKQGLLTENSYR